ncbi:MAG TPA: alpha/beta hydrolase [Humibacillus sp.]|nr:alpha/beta hydrolase [Humibacillus sp.]
MTASAADNNPELHHQTPEGRWVDLGGPVHYVDYGGPEDGPLLLLVHGLGGSLLNWAAIAPTLAETCRVMAIDLVGFGRTQPLGRSPRIEDNRDLLARFVDEVIGHPVILVGNSMGGLLSMLLADERPDLVSGLVLVDPAVPVGPTARPDPLVTLMFGAYAVPAVARVFMSRRRSLFSAEAQAMAVLRLCCVDTKRVPKHVLQQHLELARERENYPDVDAELVVAGRSLVLVLARRRWLHALMGRISVPVLLMHGSKDRLVPIGAARSVAKNNPTWRFEVADNVGHVPQLEVPEWTIDQIRDWLASEGAVAVLGARP